MGRQPRHLDVRRLSDEECKALKKAIPKFQRLLVKKGCVEVNSDAAALGKATSRFHSLFNKRPQVNNLLFAFAGGLSEQVRRWLIPCVSPSR